MTVKGYVSQTFWFYFTLLTLNSCCAYVQRWWVVKQQGLVGNGSSLSGIDVFYLDWLLKCTFFRWFSKRPCCLFHAWPAFCSSSAFVMQFIQHTMWSSTASTSQALVIPHTSTSSICSHLKRCDKSCLFCNIGHINETKYPKLKDRLCQGMFMFGSCDSSTMHWSPDDCNMKHYTRRYVCLSISEI